MKVPTMNVAAFATSAPHVSAMISKVNAFVPTSIPLFTKIRRGRLSRLKDGCNALSIPLLLFTLATATVIVESASLTSDTAWEWQREGHPCCR